MRLLIVLKQLPQFLYMHFESIFIFRTNRMIQIFIQNSGFEFNIEKKKKEVCREYTRRKLASIKVWSNLHKYYWALEMKGLSLIQNKNDCFFRNFM